MSADRTACRAAPLGQVASRAVTALLIVLAVGFAWSIGAHYTGAVMGMPHALRAIGAWHALLLMAPLAFLGATFASPAGVRRGAVGEPRGRGAGRLGAHRGAALGGASGRRDRRRLRGHDVLQPVPDADLADPDPRLLHHRREPRDRHRRELGRDRPPRHCLGSRAGRGDLPRLSPYSRSGPLEA